MADILSGDKDLNKRFSEWKQFGSDESPSSYEESGMFTNALAGGAQGVANSAISLGNIPSWALNQAGIEAPYIPHVNLPDTDFGKEMGLGGTAFEVGDLAGGILSPAGIAGKFNAVNKLRGALKLGGTAAGGAVAGAALGETEDHERLPGAIGGAVGNTLFKASRGQIAKDLSKTKSGNTAVGREVLTTLGNAAEEAGVNHFPIVPIPMGQLKNIPAKYKKAYFKYLEEPTFHNSNNAQAELGRFAREIGEQAKTKKKPHTYQYDAADAAETAQRELRDAIKETFRGADLDILADGYSTMLRHYKDKVVPYQIPALGKYENKTAGLPGEKLSSGKAVDEILNSDTHYYNLVKDHPELLVQKLTSPTLWGKKAVKTLFGSGG